jgi:hypothetical protein
MVAFISSREFGTALSVHTFSDLWLAPIGYTEIYPVNWPEYEELGDLATEVNGYPNAPAWVTLYPGNGVTLDYDHAVHDTLCWTPEIGGDSDGFWPPQARIVPLAEENLLAFQRTALGAGPWVRFEEAFVTDLGDGDGFVEAGETIEIFTQLRNSGRTISPEVDVQLSAETSLFVSFPSNTSSVDPLDGFSSGQNVSAFVVEVSPLAEPGISVEFGLTATYDGFVQVFSFNVVLGEEVSLAAFDFEAGGDEGWSVGSPNDASTGTWTRVDPNGTNAQPEDDHTQNPADQCWVTGQGTPGG